MDKEFELWKRIERFPDYWVSIYGRVMSLKYSEPRILKQTINNSGYKMVTVSMGGRVSTATVHRLVAEAFIDNKDNKRTVNHKDGDKLNNYADNLEWATYSENHIHAHNNRLKGKINRFDAFQIRNLYKNNDITYSELSNIYNISISQIGNIINMKSWKNSTSN